MSKSTELASGGASAPQTTKFLRWFKTVFCVVFLLSVFSAGTLFAQTNHYEFKPRPVALTPTAPLYVPTDMAYG